MKQAKYILLFIVCLCSLTCALPVHADNELPDNEPADDERLFKAAFIFNFARLTSWPENTWNTDNAPLVLCTAGEDELVGDLKQLGGKIIRGHPVVIHSLVTAPLITAPLKTSQEITSQQISSEAPDHCQVLYIALSEKNRLKRLLKSVTGKPLLTISEIAGFVKAGGVIELYRENNRTRFLIELGTARHNGLRLSSRLLSMATVSDDKDIP